MPTEAELKEMIERGEDSRLELKSVAQEQSGLLGKDELARELCAFANSGGGLLVLGVEDDGTISGIGDRAAADRLQRHVAQIAEGLSPSLLVEQRLTSLDGHRVLVVTVPSFLAGRPFFSRRTCFVRSGNRTREATREELNRLFVSAGDATFDEQPVEDSSVDADLDRDEVEKVLSAALPAFRVERAKHHLEHAHCVEGTHLTVAGALLFGKDPQRYLPGAYVTAIRFEGDVPGTATRANETFRGTLRAQLEQSLAFLRVHVPRPSTRIGATREPLTALGDEVWVEALTNALTHRDYRSRSQTRVFVLDSRVEIVNPGELLNRMTVEGVIQFGTSQLRNPVIANLLARTRYRDNAGLGVPEIFAQAQEAGLPLPEIRVESGEFRLVVHTVPPR